MLKYAIKQVYKIVYSFILGTEPREIKSIVLVLVIPELILHVNLSHV